MIFNLKKSALISDGNTHKEMSGNSNFRVLLYKYFFSALVLSSLLAGCDKKSDVNQTQPSANPPEEKTKSVDPTAVHFPIGKLQMIQVASSETEVQINILVPRLKTYKYEAMALTSTSSTESTELADHKSVDSSIRIPAESILTTKNDSQFWYMERIRIQNLTPGVQYKLIVKDKNSIVDEREFSTLKVSSNLSRFILGSCMADDINFESIQSQMWDRIVGLKPDFILIMGDLVYVDSFLFVPREKATESDIWMRYIDSVRNLKFFRSYRLIPVIATWDDHDFGTNDGNKTFPLKEASLKIFKAFFGATDIPNVLENGNIGTSFEFKAFGQRFLLFDDRTDRDPDGTGGEFAEWGETQHKWAMSKIDQDITPMWLVNGGQYFETGIINSSGKKINESMFSDHRAHFDRLMSDLRQTKAPVLFASGDIHFSEINEIEPELFGFKTYEITSSPIHSYLSSSSEDLDKVWPNPRRRTSARGHNIVLVETTSTEKGLQVNTQSWGVSDSPLFDFKFEIGKR